MISDLAYAVASELLDQEPMYYTDYLATPQGKLPKQDSMLRTLCYNSYVITRNVANGHLVDLLPPYDTSIPMLVALLRCIEPLQITHKAPLWLASHNRYRAIGRTINETMLRLALLLQRQGALSAEALLTIRELT
jgi:hypothetical protein